MKFWKNYKNGEIIIYAVALMLVAAGYLNYTTTPKGETQETYVENIAEVSNEANETGIGDATLVSSNEINETEERSSEANETVENGNEANETKERDGNANKMVENGNEANGTKERNSESNETVKNDNEVNETIESNGTVSQDSTEKNEVSTSVDAKADYFAKSKLDRDSMYASMISTYQGILDNKDISESQKSIATQEITKINNAKNAIMISENLILNKGFDNCVVLVNESSVNVVVQLKESLDTKKVSQIQNIISREMNVEINNIHISQKE